MRGVHSNHDRAAFWRPRIRDAARICPTPFHLFSAGPFLEAVEELARLAPAAGVPVRHWLSLKTQPLPPLLSLWNQRQGNIEVVSEFELQAAVSAGFPPDRILVNGPAKHAWLPRHRLAGLTVNFDSLTEVDALLPVVRRLRWRTGLRLLTAVEQNPEAPGQPTQFGLEPPAAARALRQLRKHGLEPEVVHVHLRTNVPTADTYARALDEVVGFCHATQWAPAFLDCGGGLPPPFTRSLDGKAADARMSLAQLGRTLAGARRQLPGLREIWLENGRYLSARAGAVVVRVLDVKQRRGLRQLICDGGRTLHALVSVWEAHDLLPLPARRGRRVLTAVHGPTCMAFDRLTCRALPAALQQGDLLAWLDAGAYHLPWETRFSHGYAAVLWDHQNRIQVARPAETFERWWNACGSDAADG